MSTNVAGHRCNTWHDHEQDPHSCSRTGSCELVRRSTKRLPKNTHATHLTRHGKEPHQRMYSEVIQWHVLPDSDVHLTTPCPQRRQQPLAPAPPGPAKRNGTRSTSHHWWFMEAAQSGQLWRPSRACHHAHLEHCARASKTTGSLRQQLLMSD